VSFLIHEQYPTKMDRRRRIKTEAAASTLKGNNILMLTPSDGEQEVDTRRESSAKCSAKAEPHDANSAVALQVGDWIGANTLRYFGISMQVDSSCS
jgi:hypothetical protein